MSSVELICEAIRKRALLEFLYHDRRRVVAPYCCGVSSRGADVLRAVQVRGGSASGGLAGSCDDKDLLRDLGGLASLGGGGCLTYGGVREVLNQATRRRGVATASSESDEYREARDGKQHINEVSGGLRLQLQS